MKKINFDELGPKEKELVEAAWKTRENAYCPYSNYKTGAAVLTDKGNIYPGCNVEAITYSATTHAERNALDTMVAHGERKIIALCCVNENGGIPCAECRQAIWEFCHEDINIKIIGVDTKKNVIVTTIGELYPYPFWPKRLKH
jgi:cytidine deaminase